MNSKSLFTWYKTTVLFAILLNPFVLPAQDGPPGVFSRQVPTDSAGTPQLNMDATYNRPFLQMGRMPVALGGYVEAHSAYFATDGITEGLSFQFPRLTLFASSTISRGIRFLTELEFEEGGREINIEFASVDVQFHPALNLRGGVVMNPIGAFNQNHDGPKWEFAERPVSATQMLPATWSNVGLGLHGKFFRGAWTIGYEGYLTNGFDESIIANPEGRTFLPAAKANSNRFEESLNGRPLVSVKTAIRHSRAGELGFSYMGGAYNRFEEDGLVLDAIRRVHVLAVDLNTKLAVSGTAFTGEWAWVQVDIPEHYAPEYGKYQQGGFLDIIQPVFKGRLLHWNTATVHIALRLDYTDWQTGTLAETGQRAGDDMFRITGGLSLRPSAQTVLRLNYLYQWQRDLLQNPATRTAGWLLGISSYF
ncbi:MAG: hypothetical protein EP344_08010 [Bacteroidetes bacterium]|nr:MAG: hypothetical protein EP344_08010 [Bacteroidota bacterium]